MSGPGRVRSATAARLPFVLLIVTLLTGGLISLLLLNAAVNSDSFKLDKLRKQTTGYTDEQQALQQEVDQYGAPGSLEQRARELGMAPGGNPAFLNPDGTVHGTPEAATAAPAPPAPTTPPTTPARTPPPPATSAPTTAGTAPAAGGNTPAANARASTPAGGPTTPPTTAPPSPPFTTTVR